MSHLHPLKYPESNEHSFGCNLIDRSDINDQNEVQLIPYLVPLEKISQFLVMPHGGVIAASYFSYGTSKSGI